jgi:hypothetical protein
MYAGHPALYHFASLLETGYLTEFGARLIASKPPNSQTPIRPCFFFFFFFCFVLFCFFVTQFSCVALAVLEFAL